MGQDQDEERWRQLLAGQISEHGRLFFRLAFRVLKCPAQAEDICQQAFLKAWERRSSIQTDSSLRGWLARVVVNESLQLARRQQIERRGLEQHMRRQTDCQLSAGEAVDARDAAMTASSRLPELTRMVVVLRVMEDMPGRQVGGLLGCSDAEVSRQLHLGMDTLRQSLSERSGVERSGVGKW